VPSGQNEKYERNRNLFYVSCSRAQKRLALLFTQKLSSTAIETLTGWFGSHCIQSLEVSNINKK
jgi:DNA helicase-2/ATP-dependent DNA helicase PcrA